MGKSTPIIQDRNDYFRWLRTVPEAEREALAVILGSIKIQQPEDIAVLSKAMLIAIVRGKISPDMADAAIKYAELMLSSLTVKAAAEGKGGVNIMNNFVNMLSDVDKQVKEIEAAAIDLSQIAPTESELEMDYEPLKIAMEK